MRIVAVGEAFPEHRYDQPAITRRLEQLWRGDEAVRSRLEGLHRNVEVGGRYLSLPLEQYAARDDLWPDQ